MSRKLKPQVEFFDFRRYEKRKVARSISPRGHHHVIMKSGRPILRLHRKMIHHFLHRAQLRFGIELKTAAIMENHIHLCIGVPNRTAFAHFLRMFAGQVALQINRGKIWVQRAWSRVIAAWRDLRNVAKYIEANPVVAGIFDGEDMIVIRLGVLVPG